LRNTFSHPRIVFVLAHHLFGGFAERNKIFKVLGLLPANNMLDDAICLARVYSKTWVQLQVGFQMRDEQIEKILTVLILSVRFSLGDGAN
jgi:hypothetical protein